MNTRSPCSLARFDVHTPFTSPSHVWQVLKGRPLKDHLRDLLEAFDALDADGSQTIDLREFILKWNEIARQVYSKPNACSIM